MKTIFVIIIYLFSIQTSLSKNISAFNIFLSAEAKEFLVIKTKKKSLEESKHVHHYKKDFETKVKELFLKVCKASKIKLKKTKVKKLSYSEIEKIDLHLRRGIKSASSLNKNTKKNLKSISTLNQYYAYFCAEFNKGIF